MAKHKRKISASQRDKDVLRIAKQLKDAGILSKQTNLHSGRYVSRGVLRKVKDHFALAVNNYRAVSAPKVEVAKAKAAGYVTIGGTKIVGPNTPAFRARVKRKDLVAGVTPIKGGFIEEVELPYDIWQVAQLVEQIGADGLDAMKEDGEYFIFKYYGNWQRAEPSFTGAALIEKLAKYKGLNDFSGSVKPEDMQDNWKNLSIMRVTRNGIRQSGYPLSREMRNAQARANPLNKRVDNTGRNSNRTKYQLDRHQERKKKRLEKLKELDPKAYKKRLEKERLRIAEYRARQKQAKGK